MLQVFSNHHTQSLLTETMIIQIQFQILKLNNMKAKVGFFDESEGIRSSMRMMCFISLMIAAAVTFFSIGTKQLDVNVIAVVVLFVVAAFAPKAIQKYAESDVVTKLSKTTSSTTETTKSSS